MGGTTRRILVITGALIAGYLVLDHYVGFTKDIGASTKGGSSIIKALQARK